MDTASGLSKTNGVRTAQTRSCGSDLKLSPRDGNTHGIETEIEPGTMRLNVREAHGCGSKSTAVAIESTVVAIEVHGCGN